MWWLIDLPTEYSLAPPRAGFLLNQCYNSSISTYPMSEEQLKAFIVKVQEDVSLQEQLKVEGADVIAIAKSAGFSFAMEDLNLFLESMSDRDQQLSDQELESVVGGAMHTLCYALVVASLYDERMKHISSAPDCYKKGEKRIRRETEIKG